MELRVSHMVSTRVVTRGGELLLLGDGWLEVCGPRERRARTENDATRMGRATRVSFGRDCDLVREREIESGLAV